MIEPKNLRCEYLVNPLGIDVLNPRLSWILESNERSQKQTAYQILVASCEELLQKGKADIWDRGKVESDQSIHIIFQGKPLKSQMVCYWKVRVWDSNDTPSKWSAPAMWTMGLLTPEDWKAKWIGAPKKRFILGRLRKFFRKKHVDPSPLLRKSFTIDTTIKRAIAYITALGEYELTINGERIGDQIFAPEWTDYHKRVQYQTYDVTQLIQKGENVIGAVLADGWCIGNIGIITGSRIWGNDRRLLFQMTIEFSDGTVEEILSNGDWKILIDGPIQRADHFLGEIYDSRKEQMDWDMPGFEDSEWESVVIDNQINANLVAQMNEPIRIVKEIKPISVTEVVPGVFIFDLGQNIAGWCKIRLNKSLCEANQTVVLRHGEMLRPDGSLFVKNLRFAKAIDKFIFNGSQEREFHPHFTYHGFQYVEVTGLKENVTPDLDIITGCVISSDTPLTGAFECSDPVLDKLWNNILWTQRGNLISVPTDCPQRDERLGWMGDVQVFSQTSIFNMDMAAFYTKWIHDIRDAQWKDGRYSNFAPNPTKHLGLWWLKNAPAWADCGIILPWIVYLNYGDTQILKTHYHSAKLFVDNIYETNRDLIWKKQTGGFYLNNYGDWLNGDTIKAKNYPKKSGTMPKNAFATAYYANSTQILANMAQVLDLDEDFQYYSRLAEGVKKAFIEKFVNGDGRIKGDAQSAYALALHFNLLPKEIRPLALSHLIEAIKKYDWRLSTGICSTRPLMLELTRWGHNELAYSLLLSRRFPSWLYMIDQHATTIWERWDGYIPERGFQSKYMCSFNHFVLGSVGEWMYKVILGINLDEIQPGYKHIIIKPLPGGNLTWVKGHYNSIRGNITVEWNINDGNFQLKVTIPANTTATIHIPTTNPETVTEGGSLIENSPDIRFLDFEENMARYEVDSGTYLFRSRMP